MKVKCAAQVFSHTVHAALLTYICSGDPLSEAYHTAAFVKSMDYLLDVFNSSSFQDFKVYKRALTEGRSVFERLTVLGFEDTTCTY